MEVLVELSESARTAQSTPQTDRGTPWHRGRTVLVISKPDVMALSFQPLVAPWPGGRRGTVTVPRQRNVWAGAIVLLPPVHTLAEHLELFLFNGVGQHHRSPPPPPRGTDVVRNGGACFGKRRRLLRARGCTSFSCALHACPRLPLCFGAICVHTNVRFQSYGAGGG